MIVHLSKEVQDFIKSGYKFYNDSAYYRPDDVWYQDLGYNKFEVIRNNKELKEINKEIIIHSIKNL
jgi:hypothetical protein